MSGKEMNMDLQTNQSPHALLKRIDAIMRELQALRQSVQEMQTEAPETNLTQQLYGALGQGDWNEYDLDLEWQRFDR
jgi:uncharacterized membrane protein